MELYLDGVLQPEVLEVFRDLEQKLSVKPFVRGDFTLLEIDASMVPPSDSLSGGGGGALGDMTVNGYSLHYGSNVNLTGWTQVMNYIFQMGYKEPTVTLTGNAHSVIYEKGTSVLVNNLTANVVRESNDIESVKFYQSGTLIHTVGTVNPSSATYSYNPNATITDTTTFAVRVKDVVDGGTGGNEVVKTITYNYVYPYYTGWGNAGLTATQVKALTKLVQGSQSSVVRNYTTTIPSQVFYFAYPKSYGALTSILDKNGYEVLADFILRDEPIVGLDTTSQNYYIYEFKNLVVPNDYQFTYKR